MTQTRRPKLSALKTILLAAQPLVGGQAVMEGVMMRSPNSFAVAVRRRNGNIVVREDAWRSLSERFTFLKWPLLRGATMLIESMYNGISALYFSAAQMMEDENPEEAEKSSVYFHICQEFLIARNQNPKQKGESFLGVVPELVHHILL